MAWRRFWMRTRGISSVLRVRTRRGRVVRTRLDPPPAMRVGTIGRISDVVFYGFIDFGKIDVEYVPTRIESRDRCVALFGEIGGS